MKTWFATLIAIVISMRLVTGSPAADTKPVKVFILAGQSNNAETYYLIGDAMGKAMLGLLGSK